jgi:hypothetical protein
VIKRQLPNSRNSIVLSPLITEDRGQKTEVRGQRSEDRRQRSEVREQRSDIRVHS